MAIPDYQSIMLPLLSVSSDGERRIGEVVFQLTSQLELNDEDRAALLPSDKQTIFANRVHWAKTYLAKAGLLLSTKRGHFRISERGKEVLKQGPATIDNRFLSQFVEFRAFTDKAKENEASIATEAELDASTSDPATPDETMRLAHAKFESALAQELLERILASPPDFFERLIVNLLLSMGYGGRAVDAGRAIGKSGDDGVDGVIDQDALGLDRVYVQAKRYAPGNNIGSGAIRDFFGSLDRHKAAKGLFVTTSTFSLSAKETAELLSKRIVLIDGKMLTALMIRYNVGCRVEETLQIRKLDEDFFD